MLKMSDCFHNGIAVADIYQARESLGESLGVDWSPVRSFDPLPFWTPEAGDHEIVVHACYSREGPVHLELCQGNSPFYDPAQLPDSRHIGFWTQNLADAATTLQSLGWRALAAGASPDDGYGLICYLMPPNGGLIIELVDTALQPVIAEWVTATE
jgi:hypothetical protein